MSELGNKCGQFVSGSFTKLILRQKSDQSFEIGQLLVAGTDLNNYTIFQINNLAFGSQIPPHSLELMAGYQLERDISDLTVYESELRNYVLATARPLVQITLDKEENRYYPKLSKTLPRFLSAVYEINDDHLKFLKETKLENPITIGNVRSGSKMLETTVNLEAIDVFTHHILIPATTGRGKSNLVKVMVYNILKNEKCGILVFDPHNEYYESLEKHPESVEYIRYYTTRGITGSIDLRINTKTIKPAHISSSINLTDAQRQAITLYYREAQRNSENWIENIFTGARPDNVGDPTMRALRRKIGVLLYIHVEEDDDGNEVPIENGIYRFSGFETTIEGIIENLQEGRTVIIDSSLLTGSEEIFVATIIVEALFNQYRRYKFNDELDNYPVISIVLEEAPRVIGEKVLEARENIFGKIAREGRKFNIGLIAITQLPSVIPREVLANMNTKIILGNEMGPERKAIIESAAQDLSDDYQTIASLDKGEAIISSNFTKFAIPIKIPLFEDIVRKQKEKTAKPQIKKNIPGLEE